MLLFADSFDHYSDMTKKWTAANSAYTPPVVGRFGTRGLWFWEVRWAYKDLGSNHNELIAGAAVIMANPSQADDHNMIAFQDGTTSQVSVHYRWSDSTIRVYRNGSTLLASVAHSFVAPYVFLEVRALFDNSAGEVEVRVEGVPIINATGLDTQQSANAYANRLRIGDLGTDYHNLYMDDLYLLDTTGGAPTNDFLGDIRVEAIMPNGNGTTSQLDGSDGNTTDNYLLVDENAPGADDDTTYVESSDIGDKDTYNYASVSPATGTVYGVQINPYAKKTDAGSRSIVSVARHSGTEEDGDVKPLSSSYLYLPDIRETKPGGGAWTIADVNAAEFGMKVNA